MYLYLVQGATGTGKTTLVKELEKYRIAGMPVQSFVNDRRRQITGKGLSRDTDTSLLDYFTYYASYLALFQRGLEQPGITVLDRSILDTIVYSRLQFSGEHPVGTLGRQMFSLLREKVNGIFYLPIEFEPVGDGCRNVDPALQRSFDRALLALLAELEFPFLTLRGTVDERARQAVASLERQILPAIPSLELA